MSVGEQDRKARARVLVTGATGFVGSHVHELLAERSATVIGGTRDVDKAKRDRPEREFVAIDLGDVRSVDRALVGIDRVVYLVHSMADRGDYAEAERRDAENFRDAAARAGLERIVYLGGPRPTGRVSRHLKSRLETGETLRAGRVPVVELQATMILGAGSESFRIVRDLAARLPMMVFPKWLRSRSEPVAIDDVANAIVYALEMPLEKSVVLGAPGPEAISGKEIILRTARALGQRPQAIEVPIVTPRLSSYWIRLVTRANPRVAVELVEGLRSDILSKGPTIWAKMPGYSRKSFDEAIAIALRDEEQELPPATRLVERFLHGMTRPARALRSTHAARP